MAHCAWRSSLSTAAATSTSSAWVFDKLLVNFTWWVNRQDASDKNSNSLANSRSGWPGWPGRATDSSSRA